MRWGSKLEERSFRKNENNIEQIVITHQKREDSLEKKLRRHVWRYI